MDAPLGPDDAPRRPAPDELADRAVRSETPRPPAFRGSSSFGDGDFRDDRFDDPGLRDSYGAESLADVLAEDDRPLASPWTRLGAQVLDGLVYAASVLPGVVLMALTGGFTETMDGANVAVGFGAMGLGFLAAFVYNMYLLSTEGQTLGKRFLKLRVIDEVDGTNPGFVRAVLLRAIVPGAIANIPLLGFLFSIADALFIFREDRKCIHDHFAKTVVVTEAGQRF